MKKVLFIMLAILFLFVCVSCSQAPLTVSTTDSLLTSAINDPSSDLTPEPSAIVDPDFRNAKWGMSKEEVISSEQSQPDESSKDSIIYYEREVAGFDAILGYSFTDNRLSSGLYVINTKHTNDNDYIDDYDNIKKALISKYGTPDADRVNWKNDLFKDDPQDYGLAVAVGDLEYTSVWEKQNGSITLHLSGDNYDITLGLLYMSKEARNDSTTNVEGL